MSARPPLIRVILGWLVHFYTATGLLISAAIAMLLLDPTPDAETFRNCFFLMFAATVVDASDGTFARMVRIKESIPSFDGRRLDDLVDFLTYACLPILLIDRANLLPPECRWILLIVLLASGYGFSQTNIKTPDGSFVGFPSYWNIVAFYLYVLDIRDWAAFALLLLFAILTFIPSRYYYPTQPGKWNRLMLFFGIPWSIGLICVVYPKWDTPPNQFPPTRSWIAMGTLAYPILYLCASWFGSLERVAKRTKTVSN